jgi:Jacalin-like lectin domain
MAYSMIKVTYVDDQNNHSEVAHHGGRGGEYTSQFELRDGEHIVAVAGRHDENGITQLCFVTNLGTLGTIGDERTLTSFNRSHERVWQCWCKHL